MSILNVLLLALFVSGEAQISWFDGNYNAAVNQARDEGRQIFIAFLPAWSDYSNKIVEETLPDASVAEQLNELVCLKYVDDDLETQQVIKMYNVTEFPTIVVANPDGRIEDVITGFIPAAPLVSEMERIKAGENTVGWHRALLDEDPEDLDRRYALAAKLGAVGSGREAAQLVDSIRRDDPNGETVVGARVHRQDIWGQIAASAPAGDETFDLMPLYIHLETVEPETARFEGWNEVANFQAGMERWPEAREAYMKAYPTIPESMKLNWNYEVASYFLNTDADEFALNEDEQMFTHHLAAEAAQRAIDLGNPEVESYGLAYSGEDYDAWLAERLDLLTWTQYNYLPGTDAERIAVAIETCKKCIELDPENPEYQGRLEMLEARL